jgi:SMI1 / KNR4 family (SUKH-1)
MDLAKVKRLKGKLVLASTAEVDALESKLKCRMPDGYREYITTLGEGFLGGTYVRVYPPWRITGPVDSVDEWRKRIRQYWFWDKGKKVLTKAQALESIIFGDTYDGDELVFLSADPDWIYVLPRNNENIFKIGPGLSKAIDWLCSSGVLTEVFKEREFDPFDSRKISRK